MNKNTFKTFMLAASMTLGSQTVISMKADPFKDINKKTRGMAQH